MLNRANSNDYDLEPVQYCARCYSLKIRYEEIIDSDCCMECGCSDIKTASIHEWEQLYEKKYGKKYTQKSNSLKGDPIFKLPIGKLKMKVYDSPSWRYILKSMYSNFPGGLSRADSVILLFDKLVKDNRLDDLRYLLLTDKKIKFKDNGREEVKA